MPRRNRRSRPRLNARGLSEIVGTLMLVLIVVAAATAFSFFVASYEQTLLAQENANHQRALESLHVLSVQALPGKNGSAKMSGLNFTIASGDVNPMQISDILVNGNAVISYNATYVTTRTTVHVGVAPGDTNLSLNLSGLEEAQISLDLAPFNSTTNNLSSFLPGFIPTSNSFLELNFQTSRGNNFNATYIPPTALADFTFLEYTNASGVEHQLPLLDGSHSFQQGGNGTIVAWDWLVSGPVGVLPGEFTSSPWGVSGIQVDLGNLSTAYSYNATLTVYNSLGLFGVSTPIEGFQG